MDTSDDFLRTCLLWQDEEGCVFCYGYMQGPGPRPVFSAFEHRIGKRVVPCAFCSAMVPVAPVETGGTAVSHGARH